MSGAAYAEDIKIGVILGFTGPLESITPDMGAGAELAMKEVSDSGKTAGWLDRYTGARGFDLHRRGGCHGCC